MLYRIHGHAEIWKFSSRVQLGISVVGIPIKHYSLCNEKSMRIQTQNKFAVLYYSLMTPSSVISFRKKPTFPS